MSDDLVLQNVAEPYFYPGSRKGCLILHGFGGSPQEAQALGVHLGSAGYTVSGARLAGHGRSTSDFFSSRFDAWLESANRAFDELNTHCTSVVIVGFSLGGGLGLQLARAHSFAGLVTMGSRVLPVPSRRPRTSKLLHAAVPWLDPSYGAREQLREAVAYAQEALPHVHVPALIMHGLEDDTVTVENARAIFEGVATKRKELVLWDATGHDMLTSGPHRQEIFERVNKFVEAVSVSDE
jgi:carboxylesterase